MEENTSSQTSLIPWSPTIRRMPPSASPQEKPGPQSPNSGQDNHDRHNDQRGESNSQPGEQQEEIEADHHESPQGNKDNGDADKETHPVRPPGAKPGLKSRRTGFKDDKTKREKEMSNLVDTMAQMPTEEPPQEQSSQSASTSRSKKKKSDKTSKSNPRQIDLNSARMELGRSQIDDIVSSRISQRAQGSNAPGTTITPHAGGARIGNGFTTSSRTISQPPISTENMKELSLLFDNHVGRVTKELSREVRAANEIEANLRVFHPNDPAPSTPQYTKYRLGWGIIHILLPNDDGRGPSIVPFNRLRKEDKGNSRNLLSKFGGSDLSNLHNMDPKHAMQFGIKRSYLEGDGGLNSTPKPPFSMVKWAEGAIREVMWRYTGLHRGKAFEIHFKDTIKAYNKTRDKIEKNEQRGISDNDELRDQLEEYTAVLRRATWLVEFFDQEAIEADKDHCQSMFLRLITNNEAKAMKDSPEVVFKQIMNALFESMDNPQDFNAVINFSRGLDTMKKNELDQLLSKNMDIINTLLPFYRFTMFKEAYFSPTDILDCQKNSWALVKPFITPSYRLIRFLSAASNLPEDDKCAWYLYSHYEGAASIPAIFDLLANDLVQASEHYFSKYLAPVFDEFGTASDNYKAAYNQYALMLIRHMKRQIATIHNEHEATLTSRQRKVLKKLPKKLEVALVHHRFKGPGGLPAIQGGIPLASPLFIKMLMQAWTPLKQVVQLISSTFMPDLELWQQSATSNSAANLPFQSISGALPYSLSYFFHRSHKDWPGSTISQIAEAQYNPVHPNRHYLELANHIVLEMFWGYRLLILQPHVFSVEELYEKRVRFKDEHDESLFAFKSLIQDFTWSLAGWAAEIKTLTKKPFKALTPRDIQTPTQKVNIQVATRAKEYRSIIQDGFAHLEKCPLNFVVAYNNNNSDPYRKRVAEVTLDDLHFQVQIYAWFKEHPDLIWFTTTLYTRILEVEGFSDFPRAMKPPPLPRNYTIPVIANIAEYQLRYYVHKARHEVTQSFKGLVSKLMKPIGIPLELETVATTRKSKDKNSGSDDNEDEDDQKPPPRYEYQLDVTLKNPLGLAYSMALRSAEDLARAQYQSEFKPTPVADLKLAPDIDIVFTDFDSFPGKFCTSKERRDYVKQLIEDNDEQSEEDMGRVLVPDSDQLSIPATHHHPTQSDDSPDDHDEISLHGITQLNPTDSPRTLSTLTPPKRSMESAESPPPPPKKRRLYTSDEPLLSYYQSENEGEESGYQEMEVSPLNHFYSPDEDEHNAASSSDEGDMTDGSGEDGTADEEDDQHEAVGQAVEE